MEFYIENQVQDQKLSGKNTLYVELCKKIGHFQEEFQSSIYFLEDSRNDRILEFHNENRVWGQKLSEKKPLMLKLAKTSQIRGIPGFLDVWILGLRNPEMIPKVHIIIPLS